MEPEKSPFKKATFGGGCFWCMGAPFEKLEGVKKVIAGYMGGHTENPTYEEVYTDTTGHVEVVEVTYDSETVDYQQLLDIFWRQIDPTDGEGQFIDRGTRYRPVIFTHDCDQKATAEESCREMEKTGKFGKPIAVKVEPAVTFWRAEDFHQRYHASHPEEYKKERDESGRDEFLIKMWGESCKILQDFSR